MPALNFHKKLFIYLFTGVFLSAIFGVVLHEFGHYAAYRYFGFKYASVSYSHTNWGMANDVFQRRRMLEIQDEDAAERHQPFDKTELNRLNKIADTEDLCISAAGPLVNIVIGTAGFLLVIIYRKRFYDRAHLKASQWFLILLCLQWFRPIVESFMSAYRYMRKLPFNSDEYKVTTHAGWNFYLLLIISGGIGVIVIGNTIFKFIPKQERGTFVAAMLTGGLCGLFVWFVLLGPKLLP